MRVVTLAGEDDFEGWRTAARALAAAGVPPGDIAWQSGAAPDLFGDEAVLPTAAPAFPVPRAFITLAETVICHKDPERFALLYALLLRLRALIDEGKLPAKAQGDGSGFRMQVHPRLVKELPPALAAWWKRTNAWRLFFAAQRARAFSAPQLHALLRALSEGDVKTKTGAARPEHVLEEVCARFCGVAEEALR